MNFFLEMPSSHHHTHQLSTPTHQISSKQNMQYKNRHLGENLESLAKNSSNGTKRVRNQWNIAEVRKYVQFLIEYRNFFELPANQRKNCKIHNLMSENIKTRNPKQCYSHHEKMVKKFGSLQAVIDNFIYLRRKSIAFQQNIHNQLSDVDSKNIIEVSLSFPTLCSIQEMELTQHRTENEELKEYQIIHQPENTSYFDSLCPSMITPLFISY